MRPRDDDSDGGNSQDIVSDEELEISRASLEDALATRVGGKETDGKEDDAGPTHFQNSTSAIAMNQSIWEAQLENDGAQVPSFIEPQALQEVLKAAKTSQKREHVYKDAAEDKETNPTLRQLLSATAHDVEMWLQK